ncbi:hypothetical protein [Anaerotignum sp. MB30-C6]|uniref:hypothetical protein n=1 Tax=Anaerotignum sp. MB30-C6 TaxID=3070814 RepID=UPI0027DB9792|nr:hypothetical protein [Anaerotignum sp. MB30-C6]WMI81596.1 hypothetical protein RBQ60_02335 [Anaerotignum sp. MB30-C6]
MVKTMDIIDAVMREFNRCMPGAEIYLGRIGDDCSFPAFLFIIVYDGGERSSKYTRDVTVDLQAVYFGKPDGNGNMDFEDKMVTAEKLKVFLNRFKLLVGDRVLKFDYEMKDADEKLAVFLTFDFKDGVNDPEFDEEQAREAAGVLYMNEERVV